MNKFQMNFVVRFRNKAFWVAFVPAIIFLIQSVCAVFGVSFDLTEVERNVLGVVEAVFAVLTVLGVVNDPTTEGFSDSNSAMDYFVPKERWMD